MTKRWRYFDLFGGAWFRNLLLREWIAQRSCVWSCGLADSEICRRRIWCVIRLCRERVLCDMPPGHTRITWMRVLGTRSRPLSDSTLTFFAHIAAHVVVYIGFVAHKKCHIRSDIRWRAHILHPYNIHTRYIYTAFDKDSWLLLACNWISANSHATAHNVLPLSRPKWSYR